MIITSTTFAIVAFVLISAICLYGLATFCAYWDDCHEDSPRWMRKYLSWIFPDEGWEDTFSEN